MVLSLGCERANIEWPIWKIFHPFPYKMEVQMSFFYMTWKDIDWLKWLNGKMVTKMANGKFLMHFLITSKGKCISSYDMKRHWSVEFTKWEDGQWEILSCIFLMKWKCKCISSCDMKKHWLVELAKWNDG
jgi:hypothetical protein